MLAKHIPKDFLTLLAKHTPKELSVLVALQMPMTYTYGIKAPIFVGGTIPSVYRQLGVLLGMSWANKYALSIGHIRFSIISQKK